MDNNRILSLLGLSLRGGHLAVGEEPVETVARAKDARILLLAADAADNTRRRVEHFASIGQCLWLRVPFTREELGRAVGRTSAAIVAITDIGLASAAVHRLAEADPQQYGDAAQRLDVKAKRAAERRTEQLAHEKNLRAGKRKPKAAPSPEKPTADVPPQSEARPRNPGRPAQGRSRPQGGGRSWNASRPAQGGGRPQGGSRPQGGGRSPSSGGYGRKSDAPRSDVPRQGGRPGGSAGQGFEKSRTPGGFHSPRPAGSPGRPGGFGGPRNGRPSKGNRPKPKVQGNPYAHSHPVKKGKGSFRTRES